MSKTAGMDVSNRVESLKRDFMTSCERLLLVRNPTQQTDGAGAEAAAEAEAEAEAGGGGGGGGRKQEAGGRRQDAGEIGTAMRHGKVRKHVVWQPPGTVPGPRHTTQLSAWNPFFGLVFFFAFLFFFQFICFFYIWLLCSTIRFEKVV